MDRGITVDPRSVHTCFATMAWSFMVLFLYDYILFEATYLLLARTMLECSINIFCCSVVFLRAHVAVKRPCADLTNIDK